MTEKKVLLTQDGYDKLVEKLEYLKSVRRIEVANRLKAAIALGDLSENSEYDDAKNEQAFLEGEILDLEAKIRNSNIINDMDNGDIINVGSTVVIREVEEVKNKIYGLVKKTYRLVNGKPEAIVDDFYEDEEKVYKIMDNEFIEVDKIEANVIIDKEKAHKLVNVTVAGVNSDVDDDADDVYRLIDGGLVKFSGKIAGTDDKIYKITEEGSEDIYGKVERAYKVYQIVDEDEKYRIVGSTETNPDESKISDESPLGAALVGKKAGAIAEVHAPVGIILYEIVKVE
ncbi:MAG: GreA/GreB family elongation factor [Selenomonadaceae bacterium]|nr:GreA/GreB family elongation factor [Selenomonadaceae bacterium]